jgi:predicted LPLAT superfamily acyltransferase
MQSQSSNYRINAKKRGNRLGFWFFEFLLKSFGLRAAYVLLYFVCLHYLIFDREAVRSALFYIEKRFPRDNYLKRHFKVYRLFTSQGKQLIDRFALISGKSHFEFDLKGYEALSDLLSGSKKGFVLLAAHVGNWQIALSALKRLNRKVHLVMRPEDNPAVSGSLGIDKPDSHIQIISPEGYLGGVVESMNAIEHGDIVSIMGDRKYGFESVEVDFLREKAQFPFGAFSIAASSGVPVVVLLSAKVSENKYIVDVSNIIRPGYESSKDKKLQLRKYAQEFADILDDYVLKYPYQCFLFHDVWKS